MVTPSVTTASKRLSGKHGWPLETRTPSELIYSAMYRNIPKSSHLPLFSIAKSRYTSLRKMLFACAHDLKGRVRWVGGKQYLRVKCCSLRSIWCRRVGPLHPLTSRYRHIFADAARHR